MNKPPIEDSHGGGGEFQRAGALLKQAKRRKQTERIDYNESWKNM